MIPYYQNFRLPPGAPDPGDDFLGPYITREGGIDRNSEDAPVCGIDIFWQPGLPSVLLSGLFEIEDLKEIINHMEMHQ